MTDQDEHEPIEHDPTFELVVPFVVTASVGGPYDDEAFAAGWQCGVIELGLRLHGVPEKPHVVRVTLVPQLDLIAMHLGMTMTVEPCDEVFDGEWVSATFAAASEGAPA